MSILLRVVGKIRAQKEPMIFWFVLCLLLMAFFLTGYFFGKNETRAPIIIEKCSDCSSNE
ncbi:hypothetical protein A3I34_02415 [Candidatus Jorgensenbacteria bacterium RIFCSPLOWO2_02_FULL_45_12]|nr:MAG: hypothetical protein A3I34_02415 [Candidatus Jorgensenbacteria bacterium RIFCSPLOWO2_02_FULL_45_12]